MKLDVAHKWKERHQPSVIEVVPIAALDDSDSEVGGPKHLKQWRDWLRWSNVLQFLTVPRFGESLPLRMAEVWTRRSVEHFSYAPLSVVAGSTIDVAFVLPGEWEEVRHFSDSSLAGLVKGLAQRNVLMPEPGAEVGPDNSVWQVELAWPSQKVAVVIDADADRDRWLTTDGWTVARFEGADDAESLIEELSGKVGGTT